MLVFAAQINDRLDAEFGKTRPSFGRWLAPAVDVVVNLVEVGNGGDGWDAGEDRQHREEGQGENCPSIGILQKIHFIEALLKSQLGVTITTILRFLERLRCMTRYVRLAFRLEEYIYPHFQSLFSDRDFRCSFQRQIDYGNINQTSLYLRSIPRLFPPALKLDEG